jgi:flagellar biosynthesis/type III secretory pathway chaperone
MSTEQLTQLIDAKHQVLSQLLEISRRQQIIIAEQELSALLSVLSAKQQILQVLQQIDQQLEPFRGEDPQQRVWRNIADRDRCRAQAERCEAILKEMLLLERQAENSLLLQREETAEQLAHFQTQADAERAYVSSANHAPRSLGVTLEG